MSAGKDRTKLQNSAAIKLQNNFGPDPRKNETAFF